MSVFNPNKVIDGESFIQQHTSPSTEHVSLQRPEPAHIPTQISFEGPERPTTSFAFCEGGCLTPPAPVLTLSPTATQIAKPDADVFFLQGAISKHRDVFDTRQSEHLRRQREVLGAATSVEAGFWGSVNRAEQDNAKGVAARCEQVQSPPAHEKQEPCVAPVLLLTQPTTAPSPVLPTVAAELFTVNSQFMTRTLSQDSGSVSTPGLVMTLSSSPQGASGSPLHTPPILYGKGIEAAKIQVTAPGLDAPEAPVTKQAASLKKDINAAPPNPTECTFHGKTYTTLPVEHQPKSGRPGEEWFCPFHNVRKAPRACEKNWRTFTGIRKHFEQHHQGCPIPAPTQNVGPVVARFSGTMVEKRIDFGVQDQAREGRGILIPTEPNQKRKAKGEDVLGIFEPKRGGKRMRFDAPLGRPNPLVQWAKNGQQPMIPLYIPTPVAAPAPQVYFPVPVPTLQYPVPAQVPYNMQVPRTVPTMLTMTPGFRGFSFDDMPMPTQFRAGVPRNYGAQYTHIPAQAPLSHPGLPHWARESMNFADSIFDQRDPMRMQTQINAGGFANQIPYTGWELDIDQPKSCKVDNSEFNFADYFGKADADESACEQQSLGKSPEEIAELDTQWEEMCASAGLHFGMTA